MLIDFMIFFFIEMSDMIGHMHELLRSTMILPVGFDGHTIFIDLT